MSRDNKVIRYLNKPSHSAYIFLAPSLVLLLVFNILPLIAAFVMSVFDINITLSNFNYVGMQNFIEAFSDERFLNSLKITGIYTAIELPIQVIGAMVIASLLTRNSFRNKMFRAIYFLPVICSATAIGIMWKMILHSNVGYITYILRYLGMPKINFMNTPSLTIFVVAFISIWRSFGISTVIYVTAIQQVNPSMYESAQLDGAGPVRKFISITMPTIKPTFWFILMTRLAGSLQIFDIIFTTTNGGPNYTTESTVSYIYTRAFSTTGRLGYASAMSIILFAVIMVVTVILYRKMDKEI
jgi:multiple sugar transport system permease protein